MIQTNSKIDYYKALFGQTERELRTESGESLLLQRIGLGRYFYLQTLAKELGELGLDKRVDKLKEWLVVSGISHPGRLSLSDLLAVIPMVRELNTLQGQPAWSFIPSEKKGLSERLSDYTGRTLARIVHVLSRHYGWSLKDILQLPPELALAHLQECVLSEQRQREWEHILSEISWRYDKSTGKSHYKPLPKIPWDAEQVTYVPVPPKVMEYNYPKGTIIDLTKGPTEHPRHSASPIADNEAS